MSYADMDHAAWVELQADACKKRLSKRERDSHTGWARAPEKLSEVHAKTFDILGIVFGGIYNAPIAWRSVEWDCGGGLGIPLNRGHSLATFDFHELTMLVFLCHEARIRCSIEGHGFSALKFYFHPRAAEGGMARRHPNLDEAIASFRKYVPADHRIFYREQVEAAA